MQDNEDLNLNDNLEILKKCANDLIYFGKTITPKFFYLPSPQFHYEIADLLMNRNNTQVLIEAPRGFAKSTLCILFVLHHCIFDPGDKVIIIQSKTQPEAINRLTTIKNILAHGSKFKRLFGENIKETAETWTEKKIKFTLGGKTISIRAIGTSMPGRGALESGVDITEEDIEIDITRITLYFLEDPDDEDNTLTLLQMDKNYDKFVGIKEGLDKRTGRVIAIGTPIRIGCIVDRIAKAKVGWVTRIYKAYTDVDGIREYLWEEMRDQKFLDAKREEMVAVGKLSKFYSEYLCQLKKGDDIFFKGYHTYRGNISWESGYAYLRVSRIDGIDLPEVKVIPINTFVGIDPASSTAREACYSVTFPGAYSIEKDIFCLPYYRKRVPPSVHADQIIESVKQYKFMYGSVETVNYQLFLRDYLVKELRKEEIYLRGLDRKWNPHENKDERLETLEPFFATGHVYVLEDMNEFIDEMEMFPDGTKDLLDGFYYMTRKLIVPDHTVSKKEINHFPYHEAVGEIPKQYRWMN